MYLLIPSEYRYKNSFLPVVFSRLHKQCKLLQDTKATKNAGYSETRRPQVTFNTCSPSSSEKECRLHKKKRLRACATVPLCSSIAHNFQLSVLFPSPWIGVFCLTSQREPISTVNDPNLQRDTAKSSSPNTAEALRDVYGCHSYVHMSDLKNFIFLPESSPSRLFFPPTAHAHPCTSSKISQPLGLADDTSYLARPGSLGLQS